LRDLSYTNYQGSHPTESGPRFNAAGHHDKIQSEKTHTLQVRRVEPEEIAKNTSALLSGKQRSNIRPMSQTAKSGVSNIENRFVGTYYADGSHAHKFTPSQATIQRRVEPQTTVACANCLQHYPANRIDNSARLESYHSTKAIPSIPPSKSTTVYNGNF